MQYIVAVYLQEAVMHLTVFSHQFLFLFQHYLTDDLHKHNNDNMKLSKNMEESKRLQTNKQKKGKKKGDGIL